MSSNSLHRLLTAACASVACAGALVACGGSKGSGVHSPERQSETEYDLAVDLYHKADYRQALDHALKAAAFNEDNARAAKFASELYVLFCNKGEDLGVPDCHIDDAERYARQAVKADPKFNDARNTLGGVLILREKYKEAIELYSELVKDPTYETMYLAWGNLGWALVESGQLEEGIRALKNSVTEPRFCVGHYRLGVALEKKGQAAAAEAEYTEALGNELCVKLQDAYAARARVRMLLGKAQGARADVEKCREIAVETKTGKACVKLLGSTSARAPGHD